jgi:hypothetical protein
MKFKEFKETSAYKSAKTFLVNVNGKDILESKVLDDLIVAGTGHKPNGALTIDLIKDTLRNPTNKLNKFICAVNIVLLIFAMLTAFKLCDTYNEVSVLSKENAELIEHIHLINCFGCYSSAELHKLEAESGLRYYIECDQCRTHSGYYKSIGEAIDYWNELMLGDSVG